MLTRQGWMVGIGAVVALLIGRLLGLPELYVLGAAGLALLVVCVTLVWLSIPRISVQRTLRPPRVYAGTPSRVELAVRNEGRRTTPVLQLHDPVTGTPGAALHLVPLAVGAVTGSAYRLPTERRGIVRIGPMAAGRSDPFGLARRRLDVTGSAELTVLPHIDDITPLPMTLGNDPLAGADHPNALGRSGEDFYGLREYVVGDDLRRVHWPSTARTGELMVRQDELPWQGRVTVVLDLDRSAAAPALFERMVSAAASIVNASWNRRDLVRLVTTDGVDTGFAAGHAHLDNLMERLAVVQPTRSATLHGVVRLVTTSAGGAVVAVIGDPEPVDIEQFGTIRGQVGACTIVRFPHEDPAAAGGIGGPARMIVVPPAAPFAPVWNRAVSRPSRQARSVAPTPSTSSPSAPANGAWSR
jgi:uncharacterized protein (DUF58 family)